MAGEIKWTYADPVTLEDSGTSAASNVFVEADATTLTSANHSNYPVADLVLKCDWSAAPTSTSVVNVYRRDLNIDGTSDAIVPASTFPQVLVGVVPIPQSASAVYPIPNVPLSAECSFYIENKSNTTLMAGWTLKATPKTFVPGT